LPLTVAPIDRFHWNPCALVKMLENFTEAEVVRLEIPTGQPRIYPPGTFIVQEKPLSKAIGAV
jgi:hypothetical protein